MRGAVPLTGPIAFCEAESRLVYCYDSEQLWVEPWGKNSLRVRCTRQAEMPREDWALLPPSGCSAEVVKRGNQCVWLHNGKISACLTVSGKLSFHDRNGRTLLKEYVRNRKDLNSAHCSALAIDAREFSPNMGSDDRLSVRFEPQDTRERLFGMGQCQQSCLDLKGTVLELAHRNSQTSVPFVLSSLGYGFLWNNPAIGRATFAKNLTLWEAESTTAMDYWVTAGDTPAEIEEAYANATGKVPMMPDYAMGFWQCKLRYQTQEELLEVARGYKKRGLPISVIVVDFFHWPLQGEWKFDPTYWPDPDGMIRELKEMGIELMVSVWPTVDYRSENFEEMRQKGYLIHVNHGQKVSLKSLGDTLFYDATNPDAQSYVWEKAKKNYYEKTCKSQVKFSRE